MDDLCDVVVLYTVQELELLIYSSHSNSAGALPALTYWQIVNKTGTVTAVGGRQEM